MKRILMLIICLLIVLPIIAQTAQNEDVIATVNNRDITVEDLKAVSSEKMNYETGIHQIYSDRNRNMDEEINSGQAEWLLEEAISNHLILSEAQSANVSENGGYKAELESIKKSLMVKYYYIQELLPKAKPSQEEIEEEYNREGRFEQPERAEVMMRWERTEEEARKWLDKFANMDEKELAEGNLETMRIHEEEITYEDGSNQNNREEGKFQLMNELSKANAGDILGPLQEGNNYVVVYVAAKYPAGKQPLEEVKDRIERDLTRQNLERLVREKQEELRKKATVTIYYENLNNLSE